MIEWRPEEEEEEEEGNGAQLGRNGPFEGRGSLSVWSIALSESLTAPATSFATSTLIKQNKENSGAAGFHLSPTCLSLAATETKRLCWRDRTYEVRREGGRKGGREGREEGKGGEGGREGRGGGKEGREGREGGRGGGGGGGREGEREGKAEGREGGEGGKEGGTGKERQGERETKTTTFLFMSSPLPQTSSGSDSEAPMRKHPS